MCLIVAVGFSIEFRDVNGVLHETDGNNVIIVFAGLNCAPVDRLIGDSVGRIAGDYPDVKVFALFPCESPTPSEIREWQKRVPFATNVIACEVWIGELINQMWADTGYKRPATFLFDKKGNCLTNWMNYQWPREKIEVPLTRQLLDLKICVSNGIPCATWRQTKIPWQPEWSHNGNIHTMVLKLK